MNIGISDNYYLTPLMKLTESYLYYAAKVYKEDSKIKTQLEEIYNNGRDNILNATSVKSIFQAYVDASSKLTIFYKKLYEPKLESDVMNYSWYPPQVMNCSASYEIPEVSCLQTCDLSSPQNSSLDPIGSESFPYIPSDDMSTFAKSLFNASTQSSKSKNPLTYLKNKDFMEHYKDTFNIKNMKE